MAEKALSLRRNLSLKKNIITQSLIYHVSLNTNQTFKDWTHVSSPAAKRNCR